MSPDPACHDFHRTEAQRRSLLARPVSRRTALQLGLGATLSLYAARALPTRDLFAAAEAEAATVPDAPVLVSVFVPGGLDLLDTLVPAARYGRYAELRKDVRVEAPLGLQGTELGAHPALAAGLGGGLRGLFERERIGFIPGIDYANPNLSHFSSRHFWETGVISTKPAPGWLARWVDRRGSMDNPFQGVSMSSALSPVLRGTAAPVAAIESPTSAQTWVPGVWDEWHDRMMDRYAAIAATRPRGAGPAAVYAAARQAHAVSKTLKPYARAGSEAADPLPPPVEHPQGDAPSGPASDFSQHLRYLAAMIDLPLGLRVATVEAPGRFDTHAGQKAQLERDLSVLSSALAAFQADLEARGVADRVLTLVWTEFGRRPQANASAGTDHGAGGVAWVMGTRARPGILSPYPDLHDFDAEDNLKVTVDFRAVYASVLEQWLGTGADEILPDAGSVGRLAVVA